MTEYKIEKKTFYGIDKNGEINEESLFRPYIKRWWGWEQLKEYSMHSDGSNSFGLEVAFKHIENAENFIRGYHKNRHKIGTYTIKTVEYIRY